MSRRKQSNPKPIKRLAGEEDGGDTEMTEQLQSSEDNEEEKDQSNSVENSDDDGEPMKTEDASEATPDCEAQGREATLTDEQFRKADAIKSLRVPTDLLTLQKVDESEYARTGRSWSISSTVQLPKGISIGPYVGQLVALSSIKQGELVLPFQGGSGEFVFVKVTDASGSWLSHLKPTENPSANNTSVFYEGGRIWCEVLSDLEAGTTLVASFAVKAGSPTPSPVSSEKSSTDMKQEPVSEMVDGHRDVKPVKTASETKAQLSPPHVALIFQCPFCGVRFSSPRTLEAHLTYYCSKKPPDFVSIQQLQQRAAQESQSEAQDPQSRPDSQVNYEPVSVNTKPDEILNGMKRPLEGKTPESDTSSDTDAPTAKSPKTGQVFRCSSCEYTADKLSSLNRHRRIHNRSGDSSIPAERLSVSPVCQSETFCKECNIQFSSVSTYRGHKEFYCKFKLSQMAAHNDDDVRDGGSSTPVIHLSPNSASLHMSMTAPLLVNGQLIPNLTPVLPAMIMAGKAGGIDQSSSPLLLKAMNKEAQDLTKPPKSPLLSPKNHPQLSMDLKQEVGIQKQRSQSDDLPLDLSCSKPKSEASNERSSSASDTDKSVKIKYEPKSPQESRSAEESYSEGSRSGDGEKLSSIGGLNSSTTPLNIPTRLPLIKHGGKGQYLKNKPIPPRQLVSRCVECNIVFYKHENYLIHKEHYCSGRRAKDSPELSTSPEVDSGKEQSDEAELVITATSATKEEQSENTSQKSPNSNSHSPVQQSTPPRPNEICYRFYCIPCKIKFSSAGTLKAHKEFYCPHGKDNEQTLIIKEQMDKDSDSSPGSQTVAPYKCDNCRSEFMSSRLLKLHLCTGLSTPSTLLRCPYCDYVTQTENRLSEHMKVHIPTKAFKCTICGYRGNTPRGMRMHGKMHIDNGESFTDEHMREYEEPPLVPVLRNGVCDKGPVDMETELIRMKNEPYKRRRSRKSFEKSENLASYISHSLLPHMCAACGQAFADVNAFAVHLRMHELAAVEAAKILKCEHCSFVADSLTNLLVHMQAKHPEQLPGTSKPERSSPSGSEGERSQSRDSHRSRDERSRDERSTSEENSRTSNGIDYEENLKAPLCIKLEPDDTSGTEFSKPISPSDRDVSPRSSASQNSSPTSHSVSGNASSTVRSDSSQDLKKLEYQSQNHIKPTVSPTKLDDINISNNNGHDQVNGMSVRLPSPGKAALSPRQPLKIHSPQIPHVHSEPVSPAQPRFSPGNEFSAKPEPMSPKSADRSPHKRTPSSTPSTPNQSPKPTTPLGPILSPKPQNLSLLYSPQHLLSLYHLPPGVATSPQFLALNPGLGPTSPTVSCESPERSGRKYCRHCDINFTYLSSFLTHKKYYCSARNTTEELSPSATA